MSLSWRDLLTTILAFAAFTLWYATAKDIKLPYITGVRGAVLVMAIMGIIMCALGNQSVSDAALEANSAYRMLTGIATGLGIIALLFIILGLITGSELLLLLLTGTILLLWIITTIHHLVPK